MIINSRVSTPIPRVVTPNIGLNEAARRAGARKTRCKFHPDNSYLISVYMCSVFFYKDITSEILKSSYTSINEIQYKFSSVYSYTYKNQQKYPI
jgi:hypothetical protein